MASPFLTLSPLATCMFVEYSSFAGRARFRAPFSVECQATPTQNSNDLRTMRTHSILKKSIWEFPVVAPAWRRRLRARARLPPRPLPSKRRHCKAQAGGRIHERHGPAGTRSWHQVRGEAQAVSQQLGTMSGTSTGATKSSDSDVQAAR